MEGARAQRTGRAHLRVPVDDMIFEIAKRPAGQISVRKAFFVSFCALQKVTRSARDWHRKTAMDGLQERQARATSQIDKTERQAKTKTKKKPANRGLSKSDFALPGYQPPLQQPNSNIYKKPDNANKNNPDNNNIGKLKFRGHHDHHTEPLLRCY